jgi:hypothetical protein
LDFGGKRSATPLWILWTCSYELGIAATGGMQYKAPSSLRFAGAPQTLRDGRAAPNRAKRLECVRLQRRFPMAGCDPMA